MNSARASAMAKIANYLCFLVQFGDRWIDYKVGQVIGKVHRNNDIN